MSLTISHLGAEVGLSAATVRYYEGLGLLSKPARTAAGYRQYQQDAVERLRFIKSAQRLGLRLREIAELLAICDQGLCPCGHSEALLRARMAEIDAQVAELQAVRAELPGRSSGIRPRPAMTRPRPPSGARRLSLKKGGERHGVLVLWLPVRCVPVPMLRLPRPRVPTLGRRWLTSPDRLAPR
jgi:DNA-binding transcriptional MerR regulator